MILWPPKLLLRITIANYYINLVSSAFGLLTKAMGTKSSVNSLSRGFSVLQAHVLQLQHECIVVQLQQDGPWSYECIPLRERSFSVNKEKFISTHFLWRKIPCWAPHKRDMFGDQTSPSIVWWASMLMLRWVAKRLKHFWSNTDQTIDTRRMPASNMFDTRLSKRTKRRSSNTRTKEVF